MSKTNGNFNWNDSVSLKDYFEEKFSLLEKATNLANDNLKVRLESMNEFRSQMKDQTGTFVTKSELNAKLDSLEKSRRDNIALWISIVSLIISIALQLWK